MLYNYFNNNKNEEFLFINFKNFKKEIYYIFKKINEIITAVHFI